MPGGAQGVHSERCNLYQSCSHVLTNPAYCLQDDVTDHCISKWIFYAGNLIVNIDELMQHYDQAWEGLPADAVGSQ